MLAFLIISPTGSGKSWVCKNDPFFSQNGIDGDLLIDWKIMQCPGVDWKIFDRRNTDKIINYMRQQKKCILWYVGTSAVRDAINEKRLNVSEIAIVLIDEKAHRQQVEARQKRDHDWHRACEHRQLCEELIKDFSLPHFSSFSEASAWLANRFRDDG